jgi:hypothetical protein
VCVVTARKAFPSSIALLSGLGFKMNRSRLARHRQQGIVDYFEVVEFQWSNIHDSYFVNLGMVVPRVEEALGYLSGTDPFRYQLLGAYRLGREFWPVMSPPQPGLGLFAASDAGDARMRSPLEQQALPWFDKLSIPDLARSSLMWDPWANVLLHVAGAHDEALIRLQSLEQEVESDEMFAAQMSHTLDEMRSAMAFLRNNTPKTQSHDP